jgi:hypothetical protein
VPTTVTVTAKAKIPRNDYASTGLANIENVLANTADVHRRCDTSWVTDRTEFDAMSRRLVLLLNRIRPDALLVVGLAAAVAWTGALMYGLLLLTVR